MSTVVSEMISVLTSGITTGVTNIAGGIKTGLQEFFLEGTGTTSDPYTLSIAGYVILGFAGIGLALGLARIVVNWVSNLGASRI